MTNEEIVKEAVKQASYDARWKYHCSHCNAAWKSIWVLRYCSYCGSKNIDRERTKV